MRKKSHPELIDAENPEWTNDMVKQPVKFEAVPEFLQARLRARPRADVTKAHTAIRLSQDVGARFRASGDGWQTRADAALKDWLKPHSPA